MAMAAVDTVTPPVVHVGCIGLPSTGSPTVESMGAQLVFAVPPGNYYSVVTDKADGTIIIDTWIEVEL